MDSARSSVDFPALGKPTSPTSAISLSSSMMDRSWPSLPGIFVAGIDRRRRVPVPAMFWLPNPAAPPSATNNEAL